MSAKPSTRESRTVLIVEDDPDIAALVDLHLTDIGCRAEIARDGEAGLAAIKRGGFDLVILDVMLPGMDGLALCREIRKLDGDYVPVLVLTAKSSELDRVVGLELGADDYLTKPFSIPELVARIKALFRRADAMRAPKPATGDQTIEIGALKLDPAKHKVWIEGKPVELTAREFDLLHHFARHPGLVYSRAQLLDQVWGYNHEGYEHTVNTHINRLRAKIEADPAHPVLIQTVWGVGYKFLD